MSSRGAGVQPAFPPDVQIEVKRLACELPCRVNLPLSRFSVDDLARAAVDRGLVATIGRTTVWRWLSEDAIRPWRFRSWIFPRDPLFGEKAARVLDLYEGVWRGKPLGEDEFVICADEKTSVQARKRIHPTQATEPGRRMRVEHEYQRLGAWAYLAGWDVHRAKVFGRCERHSGIEPFLRLVQQVMSRQPYRTAKRVFLIIDNGSSHRGPHNVERLRQRWPNIVVVHTPVHASWLNQAEIYFSVVQRKALTPNDFSSLQDLSARILAFEQYFEEVAQPFQWRFTRRDLKRLLKKLAAIRDAA